MYSSMVNTCTVVNCKTTLLTGFDVTMGKQMEQLSESTSPRKKKIISICFCWSDIYRSQQLWVAGTFEDVTNCKHLLQVLYYYYS